MNIDFHYGVTYVVSRLAGMNPTDAQIVAATGHKQPIPSRNRGKNVDTGNSPCWNCTILKSAAIFSNSRKFVGLPELKR